MLVFFIYVNPIRQKNEYIGSLVSLSTIRRLRYLRWRKARYIVGRFPSMIVLSPAR